MSELTASHHSASCSFAPTAARITQRLPDCSKIPVVPEPARTRAVRDRKRNAGDTNDVLLAEKVIEPFEPFKTKTSNREGQFSGFEASEPATLKYVSCFNREHLLEPLGCLPLAEWVNSIEPASPDTGAADSKTAPTCSIMVAATFLGRAAAAPIGIRRPNERQEIALRAYSDGARRSTSPTRRPPTCSARKHRARQKPR
jgi:hypothetical protein